MSSVRRSKSGSIDQVRGAHWVETRLVGHVTALQILQMASGYAQQGGGAVWLVDASEVVSYEPAAIRTAVSEFSRLAKELGLRKLVALITHGGVRMGASVVAMSLRAAGGKPEIVVVGDRAAMHAAGE